MESEERRDAGDEQQQTGAEDAPERLDDLNPAEGESDDVRGGRTGILQGDGG